MQLERVSGVMLRIELTMRALIKASPPEQFKSIPTIFEHYFPRTCPHPELSVFGATGLQGSAVVDALLKDGTFTPRAITRNPDSETSLKLKERGVQVVKADSGDKASLVSALQGSEAVFGVTVPILPAIRASGPNELTQGKNMVDASKEAGVKFFIFSSLPSLIKLSGGKYTNVSSYEDKDAIEEYLRASGIANASLLLGTFLENFWTHGNLKKTSTGFHISAPGNYSLSSLFTWVQHDVSESVLALLKSYTDRTKNISGKSYPVLTALYAAHSEYNGIFTAEQVRNPHLVTLGAKFGSMEEFMEVEIKKRFGQ
ncbi:NmrA-like family-domain-containing protein [Mycena maculata]|uniref:NmrA-like family-domain-containing protein n=1 Tax=Mycena maculata TaxID=230809 RepID=A0AAD7K027_9AGAR|nr:NmrA-like family-domain-containing protein [Mycena maculata]